MAPRANERPDNLEHTERDTDRTGVDADLSAIQRLFSDEVPRSPLAEFVAHTNSHNSMPTAEAYGFWQGAFGFFNERLFQSGLANCVITLTRHPRALGFFCARAFDDGRGRTAHEISLNPAWFTARGDLGSLSTLAHEMIHLWREDFGPLNRKGGKGAGGYHDKVWADKMEAIGLMPSHNGEPGGARTGFRVSHYVIEGGPFDRACRDRLGAGHSMNWRDDRFGFSPSPVTRSPAVAPAKSPNARTRFICPGCDLRLWTRATGDLSCNPCQRPLTAR